MAVNMVKVDGKEIEESKMPKGCFLIQGQWYSEQGLPENLAAYKRLWVEAKAKPPEVKKKSKPQAPTTPSAEQTPPANSVK